MPNLQIGQSAKLLDLVGNTPLINLAHIYSHKKVRIFAKLEGQNPSGSIKDRVVLAMVNEAERKGDLVSGATIVEASSGNTAIALTMVAKQKGYGVHVVIPNEVTPSIIDILKTMGTKITQCRSRGGMKGAIDKATQLAKTQVQHYYLGQFSNNVNVQTHYATTGKEIVEALPSTKVFVAGIGTGGTITGVGKRLKNCNPNIAVIGIEPQMGEQLQGLRSIDEETIPSLLDLDILDRRFLVSTADSMNSARKLFQTEGVMAGVSSGATLHIALKVAKEMIEGDIVVMFADGAWKYLPAKPWNAAYQYSTDLDETYWW